MAKKDKKVLITGSEGFVGQHLWKELESHGYEVFGTTFNNSGKLTDNLFYCDVTSDIQVADLVARIKPEHIYHLAGQPSPHRSFIYPQKTFQVNTIGTINLLEAVKKIPEYSPRILLVGSVVEYGDVPTEKMPIAEDAPFDPRSPYAISKLACYYLALSYIKANSMDIVYASSFSHAGPGQDVGFLTSDIAKQIVEIESGKQKPELLTGYLENMRDYTDVRDVSRAYRLLIEKGRTGERYNVCSGQAISTGKLYKILIDYSKIQIEHKIDPSRNNPSDVPIIVGTHDKITRETGWVPEIPIEKTLKDLLDWYRNKSS